MQLFFWDQASSFLDFTRKDWEDWGFSAVGCVRSGLDPGKESRK